MYILFKWLIMQASGDGSDSLGVSWVGCMVRLHGRWR